MVEIIDYIFIKQVLCLLTLMTLMAVKLLKLMLIYKTKKLILSDTSKMTIIYHLFKHTMY
jgi:hypothetical protein